MDYEVSELLRSLQGSELACHHFMDAGRRHETPGLETMNSLLLTAIVAARLSAIFSRFPEP